MRTRRTMRTRPATGARPVTGTLPATDRAAATRARGLTWRCNGPTWRRGGLPLLVVLGLLVGLLAGCSASDGGSSSAASSAAGAPGDSGASSASGEAGALSEPAAGSGSVKDSTPGTAGGAGSAAPTQQLARTASLSLQVGDVPAAAAKVRAAAVAEGGQVTSEDLRSSTTHGSTWSGEQDAGPTGTIVVEVPGDRLDATLDRLGRLGTVGSREVTSEDVTTKVVDTTSRLRTMRASVARVRALMADATKLSDVVALESELAEREADLESIESQLADLKGRVAMSPVSVMLSTQPVVAKASTGFLGGLSAGWDAFATTSRVVLTALGAVLPFAVVLGVVAVPVVRWWRRRRTGAPVAPPTTPAPQP